MGWNRTSPPKCDSVPVAGESPRRKSRVWGRLRRNRMILTGAALLAGVVLLAICGPLFVRRDPNEMDFLNILKPPTWEHPLGTDDFGRDILSRVVYGSRLSLKIGFGVMLVTLVSGAFIGLVSGFYGGIVDNVLMRVCDALMAFPTILLALGIMAALGPSALNVVVALSIVNTPRSARVTRSSVLVLKNYDYVQAAEAVGARPSRIMWRHILPNAISSLVVQETFIFATSILAEAALSFMGVGAPPPAPSWGNILGDARIVIKEAPWMTFFPGATIVLTVLGVNLLGDGLRDQLDPRFATIFGKGR